MTAAESRELGRLTGALELLVKQRDQEHRENQDSFRELNRKIASLHTPESCPLRAEMQANSTFRVQVGTLIAAVLFVASIAGGVAVLVSLSTG